MRTNAHPILLQAAALASAVLIMMLTACAPLVRTTSPAPATDARSRDTYFPHTSPDFYFYLLAAQLSINNGDWAGARDLYLNALELAPGSPYILLQLSHLAVILGEPDKAEEYCRFVLKQDPHFFEARRFLARLLSSQDQTGAAIAEYRLLLAERPDDEGTLLTLASLYSRLKQPEKALETLNELLAINAQSANAYFQLGAIYTDQGNTRAAEKAYLKAIELDPEFLPPRISLGALQEDAGEPERALRTYQEAADLMPGNRPVRAKIAYLLVKTGDLDAALAQYRNLLDTAGQFDEDIALRMGLIYFEQADFSRAAGMFGRITAHNPGNSQARYYLGHTLEKTLQFEEAVREFEAVAPDSDIFPQARIQIALLHSRAGDRHRTQQVLQDAIALKPENAALYHALAVAHAELQDYQAAIAALQQAIERDSGDEDLYYYLGHLYEKAGMFDESIAAMRSVLALNADSADALNFIGYLFADRGIRLREARTMIKKALALKPDDGYILDSLGWVYFRMGRFKKALHYLERAHERVPEDPTIAEHLGDVWQQLNKSDKARELYRRALERDPDRQSAQEKINNLEKE